MDWDQCGEFVCGYWCLKGWNKPLKPTQQQQLSWFEYRELPRTIAKNYSQPNFPHPTVDGILVHHRIAANDM